MRKILLLLLTIISAFTGCLEANGEIPDGRYRGKLDVSGHKITIRFNFAVGKDSHNPECSMDSPDQGVYGIETTAEMLDSDSVKVDITKIGAQFNGRCSGDTLSGFFSQQGFRFPLLLCRNAEAARPQTPRPPYTYTSIDTIFINKKSGLHLGATITLPAGFGNSGKVPAVVMISGSGLQDRDETIFDHRPFAVIADVLAKNGIASLRFDDRGIGQSESDGNTATTFDFKDDTEAAVEFMRNLQGIGYVGILGHSEGGTIAVMSGADGKADYIISMAGALVPMKDIMLKQNKDALSRSAVDIDTQEKMLKLLDAVFTEIGQRVKEEENNPTIEVHKIAAEKGINLPSEIIDQLSSATASVNPWISTSLTITPSEWLSRLNCPAMFINGEMDKQVDYAFNLAIARRFRPYSIIKSYPGLNHLFQHCITGSVAEYGDIEETISPEVLNDIVNFIRIIAQVQAHE